MNLPSANVIPDKLINAKVYMEGSSALLGVADIELPSLEYVTESMSGLGIAGELDTPVIGHFKAISLKLKWNTVNENAVILLAPKTHQLDVRASVQKFDAGNGEFGTDAVKLVARTVPKKFGVGKAEPGKKMDSETELEVNYLKLSQGGKELVEIDKLNFICTIAGTDYLAQVRGDLGME